MENIHSLLAISLSEFKQNPGKVVEEAHGQPPCARTPTRYCVTCR
jgi:hypothetical protein